MPDPRILLIETSGVYCSVALAVGPDVAQIVQSDKEFDHSRVLNTHIDQLLAQEGLNLQQIDGIAVSAGPGSYTGLRVGVSMAKAMTFALDIPLLAVDTLAALAEEARSRTQLDSAIYFPNIDARRMEVYIAAFTSAGERLMNNTSVVIDEHLFNDLVDVGQQIVFCGSGTSKAQHLLKSIYITPVALNPEAAYLAPLAYQQFVKGQYVDNEEFRPEYVKAPNITIPSKKAL